MNRIERIELINKIHKAMSNGWDDKDAEHYFEQLKEPYGLKEFVYWQPTGSAWYISKRGF